MVFPEPVISVAIEPKTKADEDKLSTSLARLAEEDPTFRVVSDEETGQTVISGMGELHLEIIVDRLLREFRVDANVGRPQVAYRETVRQRVEKVEGRFVRQTGGRGQYGHVVIALEPNEPGAGYEFESRIVGGAIPRDYIPAVDQGIQEAMSTGVLAGYPMVDVKVQLVDGSYHEVDSSELAFKIAGSLALKEAARRAKPVLLEPMSAVEVVTPVEFMGDVMGDLIVAARPRRRHGAARQRPRHHRDRAACHHVRLRDRSALHDAGARDLHHAVQALCRGAGRHRGRDRGEGRRVSEMALFALAEADCVYCQSCGQGRSPRRGRRLGITSP